MSTIPAPQPLPSTAHRSAPGPLAGLRRMAASLTLGLGGLLGSGLAEAGGDVHWSIGIQLPPIGTVISTHPYPHHRAPTVVYPPPVVVLPGPPGYHAGPAYGHGPSHGWHRGHGHHAAHHGWHRGYREGYREGRRDEDGWDRHGRREHGDRWDRWDRDDRRGHDGHRGHRH